MTRNPEEWSIAAMVDRTPKIELASYQQKAVDCIRNWTSTSEIKLSPLSASRLKEMAEQIDAVAREMDEAERKLQAFADFAKDIPVTPRDATDEWLMTRKSKWVIAPDGRWMSVSIGDDT
ncbi:hypothetical protein [Rhizobium sp. BK456]|uniref:hypothetical protein n=1 Tax=Rhizobium sp. BK456 TaxID=2587007 RepID=UPI00161B58A1|nr:hypothetical protein [Rhizobium sp. BK456]MBB3520984.1 MoxR-like ATPase [Rhizobium sp. BK456]